MKVAILGWGSLLWEGGAEFDRWHTPWEGDGPTLKVEFSRVSKSRLGALTLVIDQAHGTLTTVAWCLSKRANLDDAACDLRSREGTTLENIGRITQAALPVTPGADGDLILAWAESKKLDAVVWTALRSNFKEQAKYPFSTNAAVSYLKTLSPEAKVKAAEYVWRAPDFVKTPLRSVLETEPWFSKPDS